MPPVTSQSSTTTDASGRKSTLFCPACGHASPVDGDWRVQARGDHVAYDCPVCDETITERPRHASASSTSMSRGPSVDGSLLARSLRLSAAWTAWPYTQRACALR